MNPFLNISHNLVINNDIQALHTVPLANLLVIERNVNALHLAGISENANAILMICDRFANNGIDVNIQDNNGNTILHHVCAYFIGNPPVTQAILELLINNYGCRITEQNNQGETPLHFAISYYNEHAASFLIHSQVMAAIDMGIHLRIEHLRIRNNEGDNALLLCMRFLQTTDGLTERQVIRNIIIQLLAVMGPEEINILSEDEIPVTALDIANELDQNDLINADVRIRLLNEQARGVSPATARRSPTAHLHRID